MTELSYVLGVVMDIKNKFRKHARQVASIDESIIDAYLIRASSPDQEWYGILWVSSNDEEFDNHCSQCQQDSPAWLVFKESKDFPEHWSAGIGPTKYQKILSGEIALSLNSELTFEIVESLLNKE
jgi:hypothetical protein